MSDDRIRRHRLATVVSVSVLLVAMLAIGAPGASAGSDEADAARQRHQQILDYWTPERVRSAIPRLPVIDGRPAHHRPDHAGGPGGGGDDDGGDDTTGDVIGAPWNGSSDKGAVGETTGKVLFTMGSSNYVCSGSTVTSPSGKSIVLTAGHCVHNGDNRSTSWATNWVFVPAYEDGGSFSNCGATTYGCWTATNLTTTTNWYQSGDFSDDTGFAVMGPGGKNGNANLVDIVGAQNIVFNDSPVGDATFAFGYPAAQKYSGNDLIYCSGTATTGVQSGTAGLGCNMTGGSSGGPWHVNFGTTAPETGTAVSVNSHIYRSIKDVMFGPVFDGDERAAYDLASGTTTSPAKSRG